MITTKPHRVELGVWVRARLQEQLAPEFIQNIERIEISRDENTFTERAVVIRKGGKDRMMIHSRVFSADQDIRDGTTFIMTDQEKALLILFLQ